MDNLSDRLKIAQINNRMGFASPIPLKPAIVDRYDRASGQWVIRNGASRIKARPMQIASLPIGKRVDLQGRNFDYL